MVLKPTFKIDNIDILLNISSSKEPIGNDSFKNSTCNVLIDKMCANNPQILQWKYSTDYNNGFYYFLNESFDESKFYSLSNMINGTKYCNLSKKVNNTNIFSYTQNIPKPGFLLY